VQQAVQTTVRKSKQMRLVSPNKNKNIEVSIFSWIFDRQNSKANSDIWHGITACDSTVIQLQHREALKHTQKFINHNLKVDHQILIIFGTIIPDTTGHQMVIQVSTSPNICFCTT